MYKSIISQASGCGLPPVGYFVELLEVCAPPREKFKGPCDFHQRGTMRQRVTRLCRLVVDMGIK